jgi:hypothetical protein
MDGILYSIERNKMANNDQLRKIAVQREQEKNEILRCLIAVVKKFGGKVAFDRKAALEVRQGDQLHFQKNEVDEVLVMTHDYAVANGIIKPTPPNIIPINQNGTSPSQPTPKADRETSPTNPDADRDSSSESPRR